MQRERANIVWKQDSVNFVGFTEAFAEVNVTFNDTSEADDSICAIPEDVLLSQAEGVDLDLGIWDSGCRKTVGGEEFLKA